MTVSLATTVGIVGLWLSHMVPDVGWCCSQIVQPDQLRMLALWASGFHIWCPTVVDAAQSSDKAKASISIGNKCMRAAIQIIRWLEKRKTPWILEHHLSSRAWYIPSFIK